MDVTLFDYELPPARIAQEAVEPRDAARLLVLEREDREGGLRHRHVRDLPALLTPGDLLVVNDTRVVPARLYGRKPTGGAVELLLLEPLAGPGAWRALLGASRAPREGSEILLDGGFRATVERAPGAGGECVVRLAGPGSVEELLAAHGRLPLPPYIRRGPGDAREGIDRERYQTVFARRAGALAAPTAGLHFTPSLLEALAARGIGTAQVTLHVGEGTFRPVSAARTEDIVLHPEWTDVAPAAAAAIAATRRRGGRIVAVGTTVVRTLESRAPGPDGGPETGPRTTRIFIAPGHAFRWVDVLVTNFHLPRSTLLMLVAAFAGRERVLEAYRAAVREEYRFYSYGDAMLIL